MNCLENTTDQKIAFLYSLKTNNTKTKNTKKAESGMQKCQTLILTDEDHSYSCPGAHLVVFWVIDHHNVLSAANKPNN